MDSPRGRIYMMAKASQGEALLDQNFGRHMDNCLGCMACMTACPSGVQYNKLIENTRPQVERNIPRSIVDSAFRKLLFAIFPSASRLRLLAIPMLIYQRTGLQKVLRASGLLKLVLPRLAMMEALLPTVPNSIFHELPALTVSTRKGMRVGMLKGCVQQVFFQHVNEATLRVLAAEGYEVVIPPQQTCCGALMMHAGLEEESRASARKIIALFEKENVEYIAINAAGCGSTMKEYGHLLRDDPAWSDRAKAFSAKCRDISEILLLREPHAIRNALPLRVAYQDACHLRHAQGIHSEPRSLLRGIPQLDLAEIDGASLCCGSAGVYNLLYPQPAIELGDRKVDNLLAAKAQALISANPGCLLHLQAGLRRKGKDDMPIFHMVELIDASIRGISVTALLKYGH